MRLSEFTVHLDLRATLACVSRVAERVQPLLRDLDDYQRSSCRGAVNMAWAFAAGEPGSVLRERQVLEEIEGLIGGGQSYSVGLEAFHATAMAAHRAYRAAASEVPTRSAIEEVKTHSRGAMKRAIEAGGIVVRQALDRDLRILNDQRYARSDLIGAPIDAGPHGPLGPLWAGVEPPSWYSVTEIGSRVPDMLPASEFVSPEELSRATWGYVCFFMPTHNDHMLKAISRTIRAAHDKRELLRPMPVFVVYAPKIDFTERVKLVLDGAAVLGEEIVGNEIPTDVREFVTLFGRELKGRASRRLRMDWGLRSPPRHQIWDEAAEPTMSDAEPSRPGTEEKRYQDLLSELGAGFPNVEY